MPCGALNADPSFSYGEHRERRRLASFGSTASFSKAQISLRPPEQTCNILDVTTEAHSAVNTVVPTMRAGVFRTGKHRERRRLAGFGSTASFPKAQISRLPEQT